MPPTELGDDLAEVVVGGVDAALAGGAGALARAGPRPPRARRRAAGRRRGRGRGRAGGGRGRRRGRGRRYGRSTSSPVEPVAGGLPLVLGEQLVRDGRDRARPRRARGPAPGRARRGRACARRASARPSPAPRRSRSSGESRTSHQNHVWSSTIPARIMNVHAPLPVRPVRRSGAACPTRGNWRKIGVRADAMPGVLPHPERRVGAQREQDAGRAGAGRWRRATAVSGSSTATWTCWPKMTSWRATKPSCVDQARGSARRARCAAPPSARTGACPAAATRRPCAAARSRTVSRRRRSWAPASATVGGGLGGDLEDGLVQLGLDRVVVAVLDEVVDRAARGRACRRRGSSAPPRCRPCSRVARLEVVLHGEYRSSHGHR